MNTEKQIGKFITSFLLFVALMLPSAIQFFHIFEDHEHISCEEVSTHIHHDEPDCHICDFHLASLNYDVAEYPNVLLPKISVKIKVNFASLQFPSFKTTNTQLRAPPLFS